MSADTNAEKSNVVPYSVLDDVKFALDVGGVVVNANYVSKEASVASCWVGEGLCGSYNDSITL